MNVKNLQNLLILLAVIFTAYLSFLIVKHYGFLVRGILGLSVIYLLYRMVFTSINNLSATANNIRNPKRLRDFILLFLLGVIVFIASQEIVEMFILVMGLLLK
jgi:uncharacterized membrane protein YfcA